MKVFIIVAMTTDRLIGKDGAMPWHDRDDLQHFKRTTSGHAVLMGRKTFESIGRPLPNRRNIVLTRNPAGCAAKYPQPPQGDDTAATSLAFVDSLDAALAMCRKRAEQKAFVIGGAELYTLALPRADAMIVTRMEGDYEGDTYFPAIDEAAWKETGVDPAFPRAMYYERAR